MNNLANLGVVPALTQPIALPPAGTTSTTKTGFDLSKVQQGVDIFQDLFSTFSNKPATTAPAAMPAPTAQGMSPTVKVGIGLAAAAVLTFIAVKAFGGKKSKKSLGDLNTAKTKAGRERQRKAVFARLAAEGSVKPKSKKRKKAGRTKKVML